MKHGLVGQIFERRLGEKSFVPARWLLALLMVLLISATPAPAQKKKKSTGEAQPQFRLPEEQMVDQAINEMMTAWQLGDIEMLHKYYSDNVMVVSGIWEPPLAGWTRFLEAYQTQRKRMQGGRLDRRNTFIFVRGNVAWAVYQWEFAALVDDKPTSAHGHTTLVLEKQKDRWVIVHNHTAIVPEMAQPAAAPSSGNAAPAPPSVGGRGN